MIILADLLREGDLAIVDVRGPDEFDGALGHIASALNLPLGDLPDRLTEIMAFQNRTVILVCKTDKRSASAFYAAAWSSGIVTGCRSKAAV